MKTHGIPGLANIALLHIFAWLGLWYGAGAMPWFTPASLAYLPLWTGVVFLPPILATALGTASRRTCLWWIVLWGGVLALLATYATWRTASHYLGLEASDARRAMLRFQFGMGILLFVAQSLMLAAQTDRKPLASAVTYFEISWNLALKIVLTFVFTGLIFQIMMLGKILFGLLELDLLRHLFRQPWFMVPIALVSAYFAFHLLDTRTSIVAHLRHLLLTLTAWLLPIATLVTGGFLGATLVTGLAPLRRTGWAATVLLTLAVLLIFLINAAHRYTPPDLPRPLALRLGAALAGLMLIPIVAIAVHSIGLRVHAHGWTEPRLIAMGVACNAAIYACGYGLAAWRNAERCIARTNVIGAGAFIVTGLLFHSPVLDPTRIAVADQLHRLSNGRTAAEKFDYDYLSSRHSRYSIQALQRLARLEEHPDRPLIRQAAAAALAKASVR